MDFIEKKRKMREFLLEESRRIANIFKSIGVKEKPFDPWAGIGPIPSLITKIPNLNPLAHCCAISPEGIIVE